MKIYKVAHENINYPKEYLKIEIDEEDVEGYIRRSVSYNDMLELLPDMGDIGVVEEDMYIDYIVNNWLDNQVEEFYETGFYNLGDFDLIIEK